MLETMKKLLVDELQIDPELITPEAELSSDLGINSIELANLIMICEERQAGDCWRCGGLSGRAEQVRASAKKDARLVRPLFCIVGMNLGKLNLLIGT